jgi:hypothetical protein
LNARLAINLLALRYNLTGGAIQPAATGRPEYRLLSVYRKARSVKSNLSSTLAVGIPFETVCVTFVQPKYKAHPALESIDLGDGTMSQALAFNDGSGDPLNREIRIKSNAAVFPAEQGGRYPGRPRRS